MESSLTRVLGWRAALPALSVGAVADVLAQLARGESAITATTTSS